MIKSMAAGILFLLFLLSGCTGSNEDWHQELATVNPLLAAVDNADSTAARTLSENDVLERLLAMREQDPALFRASVESMEVVTGRRISPDSVYLTLRPGGQGREDRLDFGLVRANERWIVYYFTVSSRM